MTFNILKERNLLKHMSISAASILKPLYSGVDENACADPGIFVGGGSRLIWQKKLWHRFFLVLSLFYWSQMFCFFFEESYHFSRFQRGSYTFQGGPTFSRGSNCLTPIETHITCDFPYNLWFSRGVRTPCSPLWIRTWNVVSVNNSDGQLSVSEL